jgi:hypothetical protein
VLCNSAASIAGHRIGQVKPTVIDKAGGRPAIQCASHVVEAGKKSSFIDYRNLGARSLAARHPH